MAIQVYAPLSAAPGFLKRPLDDHGKLRTIYTKHVTAVLGDIGSTFVLGTLPPGAVRIYYPGSYTSCSAWGVGAVLNIGYSAYRFRQDQLALNDGIDTGSANGLVNALSVAAAGRFVWSATLMKYDFYSLSGVNIIATLAGAQVPAAATMETWIKYVYE